MSIEVLLVYSIYITLFEISGSYGFQQPFKTFDSVYMTKWIRIPVPMSYIQYAKLHPDPSELFLANS